MVWSGWRPAVCGALAGAGVVAYQRWQRPPATHLVNVTAEDLKKKYQKYQPQSLPIPTDKLLQKVRPGTQPVVIVACGSFSPPTYMHLRMFEDAKVAVNKIGKYTVVGGYISPVHIDYGKKSLVENHHRVNLVQAAIADSSWIMVDLFEVCQPGYTKTAPVLDKIRQRLENIHVDGSTSPIKVMFLCGADLLESFSVVQDNGELLWSPEHQRIIVEQNGVLCLQRAGTDLEGVINKHPMLKENKSNIVVVPQPVTNDISSTAVRKELQSGSVKYLVPDAVIKYIEENDLASKPQWKG